MSHRIGRLVSRDVRIGPDSGSLPSAPGKWVYEMVIEAAQVGGSACFALLHFTDSTLPVGASLRVDLGYAVEAFDSRSGADFWTRPLDPVAVGQKVTVTFNGPPSGGVTLAEYGSGEPLDSIEFPYPPGGVLGSHSDPDVYLHTSPYVEPIYETRLRCHNPFFWRQASAASKAAELAAVAATGIIVMTERFESLGVTCLSSCSGTLIGPDMFLTARHCASDADGAALRSASVTFDFQTDVDGNRPVGYAPRWYKVIGEEATGEPASVGADYSDTDWLILRLDTGAAGIPITPCNLGRPAAQPLTAGEPVMTVHHPGGAAKKLQLGYLSSTSVKSVFNFDYAGGSSGSALFDAAGNVIGAALSGGPISGPCEVGYTPASSVQAALANPPVPKAPWDVMMVFDRSGSMAGDGGNGRSKIAEAQIAASKFMQLIRVNAGDTVGLESFSTFANDPPDFGPRSVTDTGATKQSLVGPSPYNGGVVGALAPGGSTSIGNGLRVAANYFPAPHGGSRRAVLLLTDGLQNTKPWIADVERFLADARVFVIGYGSDANLDGALLTRLARDHSGFFLRAGHGLELRKFFGLAFGQIFQSGTLADPEFDLPAGDDVGATIECPVFDETEITAIVGWDNPVGALSLRIEAPDGSTLDAFSSGLESDVGTSWAFLRIPLPHEGNREGRWQVIVERSDAPGHEPVRLRYYVAVVADGGPKLEPLPPLKHVDVGDPLPIQVALHYPNRTTPPAAAVVMTVTAPDASIRDLVDSHGLVTPLGGVDPVSAWTATLQEIVTANGGRLPIPTTERTITLYDDGNHSDGAMEPDGIFGEVVDDLTRFEGTYEFRAVATYGPGAEGRREAKWSITVGLDDDPYRTEARGDGNADPHFV
jgi:V8-like Glu-specific endopeptidase